MRVLLGFFSFIFLGVLGIALAVMAGVYFYKTPGPLNEERMVVIESGQGVREIAAKLEAENIIINQYPFMVASRLANGGAPVQAGEYQIPAGASISVILEKMQTGDVIKRFVTIPEGRTSWEIVQILKEVDGLEGELESTPPEGSLLPETYAYMSGETKYEKIARMQESMNDVMAAAWEKRIEGLPFESPEQALILASIVEKETGVASEYATVAGVFINRLRKGMPLQSDPTVIYGMTMGEHADAGQGPLGRRLLRTDLQKDTPHNTYTNAGLPPTPICNPGKGAIEAVMNPEKHDYIYFVADGKGGHAFGKTLAEHNANVAKWRKIRAAE